MNLPTLQAQISALTTTCADLLRAYTDLFYNSEPMDVDLHLFNDDLEVTEIKVPNQAKVRMSVLWPGAYYRSNRWAVKSIGHPAVLVSPDGLFLELAGSASPLYSGEEIDLDQADAWDNAGYATAANRRGLDFYIYACQPADGAIPVFLLSKEGTTPFGYNAGNSRKIGGFHCQGGDIAHETTLAAWAASRAVKAGETRRAVAWDGRLYRCITAGTTGTAEPNWTDASAGATVTDGTAKWLVEIHPLEGLKAGDILPGSIWDELHRPVCSPEGMTWVEPIGKWVDIYLQSGTGPGTASAFNGAVTVSRAWGDHAADLAAVGKSLLSDHDFLIASQGSNQSNLAAVPGTTGNNTDPYGRVMVSHYGLMDACGAYHQMLSDPNGYDNGVAARMAGGGAAGGDLTGPLCRVPVDADQNADMAARGCCA